MIVLYRDSNINLKTETYMYDMLNFQVCGGSRLQEVREKRSDYPTIFTGPRLFSVADVWSQFMNSPPVFTSKRNHRMQQNQGTLSIWLTATDPDRDKFHFKLDPAHRLPLKGNVSLSEAGNLQYKPCINCEGKETVKIIIKENRTDHEVALMTKETIYIEVISINKPPHMFVVNNSGGLQIYEEAAHFEWTVEQNTPTNKAFEELLGLFGAFDTDGVDGVTFDMTGPSSGTLKLIKHIPETDKTHDNCSSSKEGDQNLKDFMRKAYIQPNNTDTLILPCDFIKAIPANKIGVTAIITAYRPAEKFIGTVNFMV